MHLCIGGGDGGARPPPPPPPRFLVVQLFYYIKSGLPRYILYISRYFFGHIAIQTYMGYTEIDGRIDGERRKYTKSHSADATSVGPHTNSAAVLRTYISKSATPVSI